jgi:hypothetical protein
VNRRTRRPESRAATLGLAVVVLAVLGFLLGWTVHYTGGSLVYRAGWAGAPGTVTGIDCSGGNRHGDPRTCFGDFTAASGGRVRTVDVDGSTAYGRDLVLPARLADGPDPTAYVVGASSVLFVLATILSMWTLAGFFGGLAAYGLADALIRRRNPAWTPSRTLDRLPLCAAAVLLLATLACAFTALALLPD